MSIYRRKSGRYAVLVDLDPSALGARRRRSLGTFTTRKEAERAEREALTARDRGVDLAPGVITVAQLLEQFVKNRESLGRGAKTIEEYQRIANLYVVPHVGSVAVAKLRPAMVSAWIATIVERGGATGKPISAKTARHAFALLSSALRWGVRLELAGRNVCESVEPPKPPRTEAKALRDDEVSRLVAISRGTRWQQFIAIALASGARRGELLALTWDDVDLQERRMTIAASLSQTAARVFLKTTKTDRRRIVPLSTGMLAAFRAQRAMQAADRLRTGRHYAADANAVFTDELGQRYSPKSATNAIARLATAAGIETTSLHALRHTAASLLIGSGVDVRTAAAILGHSNASVTLSVYAHVVEGSERAAIDLLGDRLERAGGSAS